MAQADSSAFNGNANAENPASESKQYVNPEYAAISGVRVNPNPVKDVLQIEGLDASAKAIISVSSAYGRIVLQNRTSGAATYSVNVSKMKPGIYFVTIKYKDNSILLRFLKE